MLGFVQALHQVCLSFVLLWEIHLHQRCAWGFDFRELQLAEPLLGISEAHVGVSCGYCSLVSFVAGGCCDCRIGCLGLAVCELLVQCAYLLLQRGHVFLHRCFYCIDARLVGSFLIPFTWALGVCTRIEVALFGRMVLPFFWATTCTMSFLRTSFASVSFAFAFLFRFGINFYVCFGPFLSSCLTFCFKPC